MVLLHERRRARRKLDVINVGPTRVARIDADEDLVRLVAAVGEDLRLNAGDGREVALLSGVRVERDQMVGLGAEGMTLKRIVCPSAIH